MDKPKSKDECNFAEYTDDEYEMHKYRICMLNHVPCFENKYCPVWEG